MDLGAFSVSLSVKDLEESQAVLREARFPVSHGRRREGWLILKNGDHVIGLFQGMFERNTLTFNPGWDSDAAAVESFTDIRELQRQLKEKGVEFVSEVDESGSGPGSFIVVDPDGNPILVDQHV